MGMAENYKHLYEQTKKMLAMYQDELVPGFRKTIEDLEKNQIKVRCKDCKFAYINSFSAASGVAVCKQWSNEAETAIRQHDDFCSYGERREGE